MAISLITQQQCHNLRYNLCYGASGFYIVYIIVHTVKVALKPRPYQQQCPSNIVEFYKLNDALDNVECCFDIVERCFDIVAFCRWPYRPTKRR